MSNINTDTNEFTAQPDVDLDEQELESVTGGLLGFSRRPVMAAPVPKPGVNWMHVAGGAAVGALGTMFLGGGGGGSQQAAPQQAAPQQVASQPGQ